MRTVRLAEAAKVIAGQSPPSATYNIGGVGLPFFQGKADFGAWHPVTRVWCSQPERIAEPGDVLLSVRAPVGPSNVAEVRCCIGRGLAAIRATSTVDPSYLAWFIRSQGPSLAALGQGSTFSAITRRDVEGLAFPMPDLSAQRRIAAELSSQLNAVGSARSASVGRAATIGLLRAASYEVAFGGVVPLSVQTASDAPAGWSWHTLTDLARLQTGHTPSRGRPEWWGGDVPWIALPDIRRLDGQIADATEEGTNSDGIANSSARILPAETVVMSRTASVGFVTRMGRPMATSQDFVNWVCGPDLDPEFLMHLLIRSREEIRALSSGAIHKTVNFPTVRAFRVCVPPIAEQRRLAIELRERLASIDAIEVSIKAERGAIDALPAALLRRAFEDVAA